jgi:hypothetical protein
MTHYLIARREDSLRITIPFNALVVGDINACPVGQAAGLPRRWLLAGVIDPIIVMIAQADR